jgi:hypothetical protein
LILLIFANNTDNIKSASQQIVHPEIDTLIKLVAKEHELYPSDINDFHNTICSVIATSSLFMDLGELTNSFAKFIESEAFMQSVADLASDSDNHQDEF